MDKSQYDYLTRRLNGEEMPPERRVSPDMLEDQSDRVLLHGYTTNRDTFTVWLKDGLFVGSCYTGAQRDDPPVAWRSGSPSEVRYASLLAPNKRVYAEKSDFEFLKLIFENGAHFSLAGWKS